MKEERKGFSDMGKLHAHIIVHGRVQGVGFRYMTEIKAHALGVYGYVKNVSDGTVEAEIEGEASKVYQLIDAMKQGISPAAKVSDVELDVTDQLVGYTRFRTTY